MSKTLTPRNRWLSVMLLLLLPATSVWATHRSEAEQAIEQARATHAQAKSAGVAVPTSAEMIDEAEALLQVRQYTHAVKLANWAQRQENYALGVAQGEVKPDKNSAAAAQEAIDAAVAAVDKAGSVGGEWRDSRGMIDEAQTLANSGDFKRAMELAAVAARQGELGYEQAMQEKGADLPDFMRQASAKR